ncbi:hypothetical protein AXW83_15990 [Bosea sp. PAMC 26642]|nr:hypothetical protein AXW83_15990 [Bosea sp. PAMC 26642]
MRAGSSLGWTTIVVCRTSASADIKVATLIRMTPAKRARARDDKSITNPGTIPQNEGFGRS